MFESVTALVATAICLPALILAANRSSWLVDYLFFVFALNRGIRRVVDYHNGSFNAHSLISLTPIVVGGFAALVVIHEFRRSNATLGPATRKVTSWYAVACAMSFVVGLYVNRLAAVFSLGRYVVPLGLIGYASLFAADKSVIRRWSLSFVLSVIVVAGYGIYQYYTIPPWDAFWVKAVNFEGFLGQLEPTKMTLFSTMSSRGPVAIYFAGGLTVVLLTTTLPHLLRWPSAALIGTALLLTFARTWLVQVGLACVILPFVNQRSGLGRTLMLALFLMLFGSFVLRKMPSGEQVRKRVATLATVQNDASFRGRLRILKWAAGEALMEPLGLGLGSHGIAASRVSGQSKEKMLADGGFFEVLRTFGWIGTALIVAVLARMWRSSTLLHSFGSIDTSVALFRAWFIAGMFAMFSYNWLPGASFFWVLGGYCLGREDQMYTADWEDDDEWDEEEYELGEDGGGLRETGAF